MQTIVNFYRAAFLQHAPPRHAAMQPQARYDQTGKKYDDRRGDLSDNQIAALLRGQVAYAVPYAAAGLASVLTFDVDSDHLPDPTTPIRALLAELERRNLWAFAQYDPIRRRGYVWAPFADLAHAGRLALLGDAILAAVNQPGWKIEHRTSLANAQSDTRLPLCRHTWTGKRGLLLLNSQQIDLDVDLAAALDTLIGAWRPNSLNRLPEPPAPAPTRTTQPRSPNSASDITIDRYNQDTDLIALLESYGATHGGRRTMHCCGHPDQRRASLVITIKGDRVLCQCMSAHHNCPLSGRQRDAFGVFCAMEGLTTKQALRRLNGRSDDPAPKTHPDRLSAPPVATRATTPGTPVPTAPHLPPAQLVTTPADGQRSAGDHPKLSKSALHILAEIARHPTGYILGKNRLAKTFGIDRTTVRRNLRVLEETGAIHTQRRGGGHTDVYHACPHSGRGGHLPPTCIHESDLTPESDSAGRGGQAVGSFAPQAHDQADEAPASVLVLADDQADSVPPRDELVCGAELTGPAGAFAVVGGAAYVPSEAEPWYAAICAAIAPPPGEQADDQAEAMQLMALLDTGNLATEAGQSGTCDQAVPVQPLSVPVATTRTNRTAPKWARELHAYMQRLALMSGSELAGELQKWHNTQKKRGKARWITDRIEAVEREIERRDLLGGLPTDQADSPGRSPDVDDQADMPPAALPGVGPQALAGTSTGAGLPPPPCSISFGAGSSSQVASQRRVWRSSVVHCDWEPEPLSQREVAPREHPIATLGIDPEAMRAAHEYCAALLARVGEG